MLATSASERASVGVTRVLGVISCAAITMTAPVTHIAVTSVAPPLNRRLDGVALFDVAGASADDFFGAADTFERVIFLTGIAPPPSRHWLRTTRATKQHTTTEHAGRRSCAAAGPWLCVGANEVPGSSVRWTRRKRLGRWNLTVADGSLSEMCHQRHAQIVTGRRMLQCPGDAAMIAARGRIGVKWRARGDWDDRRVHTRGGYDRP